MADLDGCRSRRHALLIDGVTAALSLPVATALVGALGLVGAIGISVFVPRYLPHGLHP